MQEPPSVEVLGELVQVLVATLGGLLVDLRRKGVLSPDEARDLVMNAAAAVSHPNILTKAMVMELAKQVGSHTG